MNITIALKNITPILQIESSRKERIHNIEMDVTTQKTIYKLDDEGDLVEIPIYTANGIRGLLRRVIGEDIIEAYLRKDYNIKPSDFHLMIAGGGSNYQSQPFEVEKEVRELNPVISLFGASLAIEGKLIVTALEPTDPKIEIYTDKEGNVYKKSAILQKYVFIKKDDILQRTKYGRLLTEEDIIAWEKEVEENQIKRKNERENADEVDKKTKKKAIQSILAKYYIVPNTQFRGYISTKYPLTDIEKGALIKGLIKITQEQLGSTKNLGFGVCDWDIKIDDENRIIAKSRKDYIFNKDLDILLSDEYEKYLNAYEEFLEDITPHNIEISKILIKKES